MNNFMGFNSINNGYVFPGVIINTAEDYYSNRNHDFYNIYVNGDYVGKKVIVSGIEKASDVEEYLHRNKFNSFTSKVDGNSLYIIDDDRREVKHMKETLNVYLSIR